MTTEESAPAATPAGTAKRPFPVLPSQWAQAWALAPGDVLPYVDDATLPVAANSTLTAGSKAPAYVHMRTGEITGIWKKEAYEVTQGKIREWASHDAHGFGILCRNIRALDLDFKGCSQELAQAMFDEIRGRLPDGFLMPYRWRPSQAQLDLARELGCKVSDRRVRKLFSSGSFVLLYQFEEDLAMKDLGIPPPRLRTRKMQMGEAGGVEIQGDDRFQILAGRHASGLPQVWCKPLRPDASGWDLPTPDEIPAISRQDIKDLITYIWKYYPSPINEDRAHPLGEMPRSDADPTQDPVLSFLSNKGDKRVPLADGRWGVRCPRYDAHTDKEKDTDTTTIYYPDGWRGATRGFECLHTHCHHLKVHDFLKHVGYREHTIVETFKKETAALATTGDEETDIELPRVHIANGQIETVQANANVILSYPQYSDVVFSGDTFTHKGRYSIAGKPPIALHESSANEIYQHLVDRKIVGELSLPRRMPQGFIEAAIHYALMKHSHSSAVMALGTLPAHDGTPRLTTWLHRALGVPNTPYLECLGTYIFTGIIARLLSPGYKLDIVPILYGPMGTRKSTLVEQISLLADWFLRVSLEERDKELHMQLMGKAVVELDELRGFQTREAEAIKSFLTRTSDTYRVPYAKLPVDRPRQWFVIGTTNDYAFLNVSVGTRRFAPCETPNLIDTNFVMEHREQLYAEAVLHFQRHGVPVRELEALAKPYTEAVMILDPWFEYAREALADNGPMSAAGLLVAAIGIRRVNISEFYLRRMLAVLKHIGAVQGKDALWRLDSGA